MRLPWRLFGMVALLVALIMAFQPGDGAVQIDNVDRAAQTTGTGTTIKHLGCDHTHGAISPPYTGVNPICPDLSYNEGNMGPGWNELDLVPFRVDITVGSGGSVPNNQTFAFAVVVDNIDVGKIGYDVLSEPKKNAGLSAGSCSVSASASDTTSNFGSTDQSLFRVVTVSMNKGTHCVVDYHAQLAVGARQYSGSSLHANLANSDLDPAGIGSQELSIPVAAIQPQALDKNMSADLNADHQWNVTKAPAPATFSFGNVCGISTFPASKAVTVDLVWTKLPGNPTGFKVTTNIYAINPAHRTIRVTASDEIFTGTTSLGINTFDPVDVPPNTTKLIATSPNEPSHTIDVALNQVADPAAPNFNDTVTATYAIPETGETVPGQTTKSASVANDAIGVGTVTNATADLTDTESITGPGLTFSATAPSVGQFTNYTPPTATTGPVNWAVTGLTGSGSTSFAKTIYLNSAKVFRGGSLSDTAALVGSNGAEAGDVASIDLSSTALVAVKITKTIPDVLDGTETQSFTFKVKKVSDSSVVASPTITFAAGETTKSTTVTGLDPDVYSVTEDAATGWAVVGQNPPPNIDLTPGQDGTINCLGTASFTNDYARATAKATKTTVPTGFADGWILCLTGPGTGSGSQSQLVTSAVDEPECQPTTGGQVVFTTVFQDDGTYTISEQPKEGWLQTAPAAPGTCSFTVRYPADIAKPFSCAFTNELQGEIVVQKITYPSPDTTDQSFNLTATGGPVPVLNRSFSLKNGGSGSTGFIKRGTGYQAAEPAVPTGWKLKSATCDNGFAPTAISVLPAVSGPLTATAGNGGIIEFPAFLDPDVTYQLCETVMAGWMTSLGPPFFTVFNPSGDNSTVCTDFTVTPGELKAFTINNTPPPGGLTRTIGYWKNWASCTGGKQKAILDQTLVKNDAAPPDFGTKVGDLVLHAGDCVKAVNILGKSTIDGKKKLASDPAFNLAAQLLAAKLNVGAGAGVCPAAVTAINAAQALLDLVGFDGTKVPAMTAAQKTQANTLAGTVDAMKERSAALA